MQICHRLPNIPPPPLPFPPPEVAVRLRKGSKRVCYWGVGQHKKKVSSGQCICQQKCWKNPHRPSQQEHTRVLVQQAERGTSTRIGATTNGSMMEPTETLRLSATTDYNYRSRGCHFSSRIMPGVCTPTARRDPSRDRVGTQARQSALGMATKALSVTDRAESHPIAPHVMGKGDTLSPHGPLLRHRLELVSCCK